MEDSSSASVRWLYSTSEARCRCRWAVNKGRDQKEQPSVIKGICVMLFPRMFVQVRKEHGIVPSNGNFRVSH